MVTADSDRRLRVWRWQAALLPAVSPAQTGVLGLPRFSPDLTHPLVVAADPVTRNPVKW